jgi:hypothetical protein
MSYSVEWTAEARAQLAALWIEHVSDRQSITAAQAQIDRLLESGPLRNGSPLSEGLYAINVRPLRAIYEISATDRTVTVVAGRWSP